MDAAIGRHERRTGRSEVTTRDAAPDAEPFAADGGADRRRAQPRLHRHPGEHAAVGRAPGRRRLHACGCRCCPATARPGRTTNRTRWPDWYGAVEQAYDELAARCDTVFAGGLSMGGTLVTRLAEQQGDAIAGLVLVNPVLRHRALRRRVRPLHRLGGARRARRSAATSRSRASPSRPTTARRSWRSSSLQKLWKVTLADSAQVTRADPAVPQPRGPRRRAAVGAAAHAGATVDHGARGDARGQLPRGDARQRRAELIFAGSVEFISRTLADAVDRRRRGDRRLTSRRRRGADGCAGCDNGL